MWVFGSRGMISGVRHRTKKHLIVVRARRLSYLKAWFPEAKVYEMAGSDYQFRCFVPEAKFKAALVRYVEHQLTYDNFKNSIPHDVEGSRYHGACSAVWSVMARQQDITPYSRAYESAAGRGPRADYQWPTAPGGQLSFAERGWDDFQLVDDREDETGVVGLDEGEDETGIEGIGWALAGQIIEDYETVVMDDGALSEDEAIDQLIRLRGDGLTPDLVRQVVALFYGDPTPTGLVAP